MAKDKKSFLLYVDTIHTVNKLTDEQAGQLFKHVLAYVNDLNPEVPNTIIDLVFEPIKQSLKRDLVKYEGIREKKRLAGVASAEARERTRQQVSTDVESVEQNEQASTDSTVSVSDSVIVIDSDIKKTTTCPFEEIKKAYNEICLSLPKVILLSSKRKAKIKTRWEEIKTIEAFEDIFKKVQSSQFLTGLNKNNWKADLDWIIDNDTNYIKVLEGKYGCQEKITSPVNHEPYISKFEFNPNWDGN